MTFNHEANPTNLKNLHKQTTSELLPAINLSAYKRGQVSLNIQRGRALISTSRGGRSKGTALMIQDSSSVRDSSGAAISVMTPGHEQQADIKPRENTAVLIHPDSPVHINRDRRRIPRTQQP